MKKTVLFMSVLLTMVGCGGQKSPSGSGESDSATVDSAAVVNEQNDSASSVGEEKADDASLLVLTPDLTSIKALDISESNSHKHIGNKHHFTGCTSGGRRNGHRYGSQRNGLKLCRRHHDPGFQAIQGG